jgi:hypothetical protein
LIQESAYLDSFVSNFDSTAFFWILFQQHRPTTALALVVNLHCIKKRFDTYSITSSAIESSVAGTFMPIARAVAMLQTRPIATVFELEPAPEVDAPW